MERYTCLRELLPVIESALAAEGYIVEAPLQRADGGARVTVMSRGNDVITLYEDLARDMADIHVYHDDATESLAILAQLPRLGPAFSPTASGTGQRPRASRADGAAGPLSGTASQVGSARTHAWHWARPRRARGSPPSPNPRGGWPSPAPDEGA